MKQRYAMPRAFSTRSILARAFHRLIPVGMVCLLLISTLNPAQAWDGNWTQAVSGKGSDAVYDPGNSNGQSGVPHPPQKFFIPPPRDFVDVDPKELSEYFKGQNPDYTPYALARVPQDIHYLSVTIPKGYYLIEPAEPSHGSPNTNVQTTTGARKIEDVVPNLPTPPKQRAPYPHTAHPKPQAQQSEEAKNLASFSEPIYRVFVIKRLGKVIAVVPIHTMNHYHPKRGDKLPKQALAWVEIEDRHPVLKFYYRKRVYSTDFQ